MEAEDGLGVRCGELRELRRLRGVRAEVLIPREHAQRRDLGGIGEGHEHFVGADGLGDDSHGRTPRRPREGEGAEAEAGEKGEEGAHQ